MANYLGAVLQGLESGVSTGLDMYKTVQGEARAKRQEQLERSRLSIADARYADETSYRKGQDALSQANNERDFEFRQDVQASAEAEAKRRAEAEERRHNATLQLQRARLGAADQKNRLAADKQWAKVRSGYVQELGEAFKGENGVQNFTQLANSNTAYRAALASKMGIDLAPEELANVQLIPAGDKIILGKVGGDGKLAMWDPDGDGQPGYAIPNRTLALHVGGADSAESADLHNTRVGARTAVDGAAQGIEGQTAPLQEELDKRKESLAQAQFTQELVTSGPRANFIAQQEGARTNAEVNQWDGSRTYTDPATGKEVVEVPGMPGSIGGSPALITAKKEQATEEPQVAASLADAGRRVQVAEERIATLPQEAKTLREGWQGVEAQIRQLPTKDQQSALERGVDTYARNPTLAKLFPGDDFKTASDKMLAERRDLADRISSALDGKTATNADGDKIALTGYKAEAKAVLLSMPDQVQLALRDSTGQGEGALTKAMQTAVELGKPEAAVYILEATSRDIPAEEAVKLAQDPALVKIKDANQRFELAAQAMELVAAGKAPDPTTALGMVIQK